MVDNSKTTLASSLRKIAAKLREESKQVEKTKHEKCAHILVAAHGLSLLQKRLEVKP